MEEIVIQNRFRKTIQELPGPQTRLGDLTQWDGKQLIATCRTFEFWCVDALARLIRLPEGDFDVWKLYEKLEEIAAGLTFEELAECYHQSNDLKSVIALAILRMDVEVLQREVQRRLTNRTIGNLLAYVLDHTEDPDGYSKLLKAVGRMISGLIAKMRWKPSPGIVELLKSLRKDYHTERVNDNTEKQNEALLFILEKYDALKKVLLTEEPFTTSMIADRKPSNALWEARSSEVLKKLIEEAVRVRLPLLRGDMEEIPLRIYNYQKSLDGHETVKHRDPKNPKKRIVRKRFLSFPFAESESDDEHEAATVEDRFFFEAMRNPLADQFSDQFKDKSPDYIEQIILESEQKQLYGKNYETIDTDSKQKILNLLSMNFEGQKRVEVKFRKYIELRLQGKSDKEALKKSGLSPRTKTHHILKLREKLSS